MITEDRQLALLTNMEKLANISKTGYWEVDLVNNIVYWSEMTKKIHEVPKDYIPQVETGINFYLAGETRDLIRKLVDRAIKFGEHFDVSVQIETFKGNLKWVRSICHVKKVDDQVLSMYGSFQDIDDTKLLELQLKSLTDRLNMATKAADLGIFELNLKTNELFWDDKMYEIYGLSKNNLTIDYDIWESSLRPNEKEKTLNNLKYSIENKEDFDTDFYVTKPSGAEVCVRAKARVLCDEEGNPIKMIGVNKDITAKTILDEQLKTLYAQHESQNKYLTNFAHTMTHNLRSSSGNLSMLIGMLKRDISAEQRTMFIDMMDQATDRLEETIVQLNETIDIRFGQQKKVEFINLKDTINRTMQNINAFIQTKEATLNIQVSDDIEVKGHKSYFESIFQNFMTNSLKYAREGVAPIIDITATINNEIVTVVFSDNGKGIDLEQHGESVFEMYKTFHGNKDAIGIGLFLTKEQIESMGGTITLESTPGEGTTFTLKFKA